MSSNIKVISANAGSDMAKREGGTLADINEMLNLASPGNVAAVDFLQKRPLFTQRGGSQMTCLKILMKAGNERATRAYQHVHERDKAWKARKRAEDRKRLASSRSPSNGVVELQTEDTEIASEDETDDSVDIEMGNAGDQQPHRKGKPR